MTDQPSSADFIQASRVLKVKSPLGEDQLLPERMAINEGVSQLFEIQLNVRAKKESVKPEELIGRLIDVSVEVQQGEDGGGVRRPFNGLVTDLHEGPPITRGLRSYAVTIRPQMWLLSRRSDCRIWQNKTSIDIVETLFSEHGIPAPDTSGVIKPPPAQEYSVQFNELDLDYLLRRFQEDGLFYWFSHEDGSHKLHVADTANGWLEPSSSAQGEGKVRLAQGSSDRNHINDWARRFSYVPGQRAGADWNFETPSMVPGTMTPSLVQMPDATKRELYEYPSRIKTVEEAERAQKLRVQATEADHDRVFGASTSRILEAGRRFTPYEEAHPEHAYEEHVIIRASHTIVDRSYETNSNEPEYRNQFEAIPARVPLTPHRTTKRPKIEGTQVAIVAGPEGEEIHPDQYGRIKLWFPWDRKAKKDGTDTCWVRVAQNWAGSTWGGQIIPRIGMEVMVAFVDGDPDRPLVTGVVPNARQTVPYDLPANKTRSTFRTNTHKGVGFNELRFEDAADNEEVFLHAQKDTNFEILNDYSKRVGHDKSELVANDKSTEVLGDHDEVIAGNMSISVGENALSTLLRDKTKLVFDAVGTALEKLKIPDPFNFAKGNFQLFVEKNHSQVVGIGSSEVVGGAKSTIVGHTYQTTVGKSHSVIVRGRSDTDIGRIMNIRVGEQLTIKVGENSMLTMSREGHIVIKGKHIAFEADQITQN
ncbi:type VI secretion system tip protein TssI/VgrG (plasmid) [Agrobacterium rosae]|uniref:Type VI secretion system tip protein TssI/VgrG n=1 Tax=Agrobacterium rosae TaxID=1972867 RepID=A0AAE5RT79_9HYPH|nr:type VI secretion system tip protein TssI/VgrG [Agrobacterium rosae]KAA3509185.1 type VI secretion system tip protein VgrG [Agrobacterium rosae]KAA3513879.1 type VI secretion system tip protein VgrG [Agrobacterium rosae]MBN7809197.1 type VI secretion system tip protein VgrG [Agrobacterium rosae]MCM2435644.1 type VI secretion system tip protein VgrG [Agrobacterium rosae]MDX8331711.1 type VI secretion system tip protein TssI/VgrG [Agrobacterium rosae]